MIYAVADCRITRAIEDALYNYADKIIKLPPHPSLATPVASHPDMLIWRVGKKIVTYESYLTIAKKELDEISRLGFELTVDTSLPCATYPKDVRLNAATVGDRVIANKKYVSELIKNSPLELIHVNQGYAKCSTAVVSDDAIITSDPSIYDVAIKNGIDALKIRAGHVRLDGYDTGFIGGCSGSVDEALLFTGDLSRHPDAQAISDFCAYHKKRPVSLAKQDLYDYGTVFFFEDNGL